MLAQAEPSPPRPLTVGGRVESRAGAPLSGEVRVELLRNLDPYAEGRRRLRGEPEPIVDRATTDASGLFTLEAPKPGLYRVRTSAPGHTPYDRQIEPLVDSIELDPFELFESAAPLALRVLDADGKPIVSPRVSTVVDRDPRNWDENGRPWAFTTWGTGAAIEVHAAPDSRAVLEISAPGHEPRRVAVASLGQPVRLTRRARAVERSLVVVDERGVTLAEAMVVDEAANPVAETGGDGVARCLLAPGEMVHLLADGRQTVWTADESAEALIVVGNAAAISGVVMGDDGRPLAGAWVGATARAHGLGERAMLMPRAVTTDSAGRYTLPVEHDTELAAWAAAPGHLRDWRETGVTAAAPRRTLDFHLGASATIDGLVVDGAGSPVVGAEIDIESRGALASTTWRHIGGLHGRSREGGRFSIAVPPSSLFAFDTRAQGFAPHRAEMQSVAARERSHVVITLGRGSSLAGRAVDESGTPIAGATASLVVSPANGRGSSSGSDQPPKTATATGEGRFAFAHLPADFYDLTVSAPGYSANRRPGLTVSGAAVDLGDVVLGSGESLTGRVIDEDGSPIAGAVVIGAVGQDDAPSRRTWMMLFRHHELDETEGARTDAEGRFTLTDLSAGQAIDLYADAPGYGLGKGPRIVTPTEEEVEIRLRRAGSVAGRVVDREGEPIVATLAFERGQRTGGFTSAGERSSVRGTTDIDGHFAIEDLAPGPWQLEVLAPTYELRSLTVAITTGERTAMENVVLDREDTAEVRGTVTDAHGIGVSATVGWFSARHGGDTQTDPTGAYVLPAVPIGEASLSARRITGGAERVVQLVVVEGENTVDFTLDGATVEGRAIDVEGNAVAGVSIWLHGESSAAYTHTSLDGSFVLHDLTPGRYQTRATKEGMTPREQLILDLGAEGESGVEIVMTKGAIIRGRILGVRERELAEVRVMAFGMGDASARVLADGTYRVDGVGAGEWTIAGHTGDFRAVRETVTLAPDASVATLDLDFSGPRFNVKGRAHGPDGPVQDGVVTIRDVFDGPDKTVSNTWTDHEGGFDFGPLPPGRYVIEVYAGSRRDVPALMKVLTIEEDDIEIDLTAHPLP